MTVFVDMLDVVAIALVILFTGAIGIAVAAKSLMRWARTGFCRHEWELERTNSVGQHHWYKCTKCDEERLR